MTNRQRLQLLECCSFAGLRYVGVHHLTPSLVSFRPPDGGEALFKVCLKTGRVLSSGKGLAGQELLDKELLSAFHYSWGRMNAVKRELKI